MKRAICYFSATGNSFEVATRLNEKLNAEVFYIPNVNIEDLVDFEEITIVSPIYSFSLPVYTRGFVDKLGEVEQMKDKKYNMVVNYAGFCANTPYVAQQLFAERGLELLNFYGLSMPLNFTIFFTMSDDKAKTTLEKAPALISNIADDILAGKKVDIKKNKFKFMDNAYKKAGPGLKYREKFTQYFDAKACISCGLCEKVCPTKNIELIDGKPVFGDNCINCLACYHRCPQKAINYSEKTKTFARYKNPNMNLNEMK